MIDMRKITNGRFYIHKLRHIYTAYESTCIDHRKNIIQVVNPTYSPLFFDLTRV